MQAPCRLRRIAVNESYIDIFWQARLEATRCHSYWLKLLSGQHDAYAGIAEYWSDGSNFQPDAIEIRDTDRIERASVIQGANAIKVIWTDGDNCVFELEDLWKQARNLDPVQQIPRVKWDALTRLPACDYAEVMDTRSKDGLMYFLHLFLQYGLCLLENVPGDAGQIQRVANRVSTLEPTHLGETFALEPTHTPRHLGETSDEIAPHIDLVYKQNPPTVEMLQVLKQAKLGGENFFVDALTIIDQMGDEDIDLLRETSVWFVADSETTSFRSRHPVLDFQDSGAFRGMYYNEQKIVFPVEAPSELYFAFSRLRETIRKPQNVQTILLPENSIALFHNLRTLHGRRAFADGDRRLIGCFVSGDDLNCKYRVLTRRA